MSYEELSTSLTVNSQPESHGAATVFTPFICLAGMKTSQACVGVAGYLFSISPNNLVPVKRFDPFCIQIRQKLALVAPTRLNSTALTIRIKLINHHALFNLASNHTCVQASSTLADLLSCWIGLQLTINVIID